MSHIHKGILSFFAIALVSYFSFNDRINKINTTQTLHGLRRLDAVNFDVGFEELKKYKKEHGDLLVSQGHVIEVNGEEIKLGRWVQRLRQLHKNTYITPKARSGFGQMSDKQKSQLESIGFLFELPDELKPPEPVEWDSAYDELAKFKKEKGNCLVPQSFIIEKDGNQIKLGKWVQRQRQVYKNTYITPKARKSFGQLSDEQRDRLNELEFEWEVPEELKGPPPVDWDEAYEELVKFAAKNKSARVPEQTLFGANKQDLGKWVQRQRQLYKNTYITPHARKNFGQLSTEQRDKLIAVGMKFDE